MRVVLHRQAEGTMPATSTPFELGSAAHLDIPLTHFNTKSLATMPLPLPLLPEQHRIVAKVGELMDLCGRLEAQLTTTQTYSRRLLESDLHQAISLGA